MFKPKIIFFGTPDFVIPILKVLDIHFNLVGLVTAPDQPTGRKKTLTPSPAAQLASQLNIPTFKPIKLDMETTAELQKLQPDLFVVAAYGKIIPQAVLDLAKQGALNIHPSLLPKYRGASPIQAALLNGDKVSGLTIIKMDAKMDHGPIAFQEKVNFSEDDTLEKLHNQLFEQAAEILIKIIPDFLAGKTSLKEQAHDQATFCKIIKRADGYFEIDNPPDMEKLDRMVRAYYPWPTAWTRWQGKIIKLLPGKMVQMEGKKPVPLADFLRGYPGFPLKSDLTR